MSHGFARLLVLAATLLALTSPARAAFTITGDPTADGPWASVGNSLQFGKYIRGEGNFGFDMYRAEFLVSQASGLASTGWASGDTVIAMGGVIVGTPSGGFTNPFSGEAVNANLTQHVRIVSKFTNTANGFTPSGVNFGPDKGNGAGSFGTGDGGLGSILIATLTDTFDANGNLLTNQQVTNAGAGVLTLAGINQRWDGGGVTNVSNQNARFIYKIDPATELLTSWEVLLNTSRLGVELGTNTTVPNLGGHWNQALQRGTKDYTDAINQHMPLPPTLVALVGGAGLLGLGRRLRRAA